MADPYGERLSGKLNSISPGIAQEIQRLPTLADDAGFEILKELLASACQSTNEIPLRAGRRMIAALPSEWLKVRLPPAITAQLSLEDDGEFCRLVELLHFVSPSLIGPYIQTGLASGNPHVREAAEAFAAGRFPQTLV